MYHKVPKVNRNHCMYPHYDQPSSCLTDEDTEIKMMLAAVLLDLVTALDPPQR